MPVFLKRPPPSLSSLSDCSIDVLFQPNRRGTARSRRPQCSTSQQGRSHVGNFCIVYARGPQGEGRGSGGVALPGRLPPSPLAKDAALRARCTQKTHSSCRRKPQPSMRNAAPDHGSSRWTESAETMEERSAAHQTVGNRRLLVARKREKERQVAATDLTTF